MDKDLSTYLRETIGSKLTEDEIRNIMLQVLKGTNYIHKNGYFHRDLKPENILIEGDSAKVSDFGLIKKINVFSPMTEYVSTRWYRAPE